MFVALVVGCASPLGPAGLTPPGGSGGAGGSSALPADAQGSGGGIVPPSGTGGSGGSVLNFGTGGAGGTSTSYAQPLDPTFDPSLLAIDAGTAVDAGGPPSTGIVIFDRSGSMSNGWTTASTDNPDSAVMVSKWVAASRALIGSLTPVEDRVTIGAILFPTDGACGVAPFGDAAQFAFMPARQFIQDYIARSPYNQPNGNTPLTTAFQVADQAIQTARDEGRLQGRFFVMLLTDGEPNCTSDMPTVLSLTSAWLAQGIQTYVFGLPGSESAHAVLDAVAQAGGTQTLVVPGSSEQLQAGMAAVY
jgi:von Willebrand factor type A domain